MKENLHRERMKSGKIYYPSDSSIMDEQAICMKKMYEYNSTRADEQDKRKKLLLEAFGGVGENCYIEAPYYANWGGKNVFLRNNVYANFGVTFVDDSNIFIGDSTMIAPNVIIATATHPISPKYRKRGYQYNLEVKIGSNVWIGAGAIIMPGVTIGDNSVIGAGSVVTKSIPNNVVAVGNPCKVLREITEKDDLYYDHDKLIDIE